MVQWARMRTSTCILCCWRALQEVLRPWSDRKVVSLQADQSFANCREDLCLSILGYHHFLLRSISRALCTVHSRISCGLVYRSYMYYVYQLVLSTFSNQVKWVSCLLLGQFDTRNTFLLREQGMDIWWKLGKHFCMCLLWINWIPWAISVWYILSAVFNF